VVIIMRYYSVIFIIRIVKVVIISLITSRMVNINIIIIYNNSVGIWNNYKMGFINYFSLIKVMIYMSYSNCILSALGDEFIVEYY